MTNAFKNIKWRDVVGYDGKYKVSNHGEVLAVAIKKKRGRFYQLRPEKILKPNKKSNGYYTVDLYGMNGGKTVSVHRLVAEAFIENPHKKPQINHLDGDKTNNCSENLEWATAAENIDHSIKFGLKPNLRGEKSPNTNLKWYDVEQIRKSKEKRSVLASRYNVGLTTIGRILRNESWQTI